MSENVHESGGTGPSHRTVEIAVAGALGLLAIIGMYGSVRVGIGWGAEGPRAGFFPFYVSALVLISCGVNMGNALRQPDDGKLFAKWHELGKVASVVVPVAIYAGLIPYIGLYVASALLIGVFMRWFGKYGWPMVLTIAIAVPVLTFFMFEIWFLVPLPKGPLENYLGY
ncbi:MAG TPA: tripartite tricarboxylate transporter TctB family protein [Gemmataceae bacterium]|jgi:hypothetical protein|nr:tripartite tricarboxylate transporter TctB family protein [Gemmataceae bacterium]